MRASTACSSPRCSSTGIYCRPVCPAPAPKRENITYYRNAAAAEAAGFRPCLRCRPELSPGDGTWRRGDASGGARAEADRRGRAGRPAAVGAGRARGPGRAPVAPPVRRTPGRGADRRARHAPAAVRQATADRDRAADHRGRAGGRLRQPAPLQRDVPRRLPAWRRATCAGSRVDCSVGETLVLRLGYRPPYDFAAMLDFLRGRALAGRGSGRRTRATRA